jgi:Protein of unknown function (DUF550)
MKTLPEFLTTQLEISKRAHGDTRAPLVPLYELQTALRHAHESPNNLYVWADIVMAAIEGALRSGSTPFAIAQALVHLQTQAGARKYPPPLAHMPQPQQRVQPAGEVRFYDNEDQP